MKKLSNSATSVTKYNFSATGDSRPNMQVDGGGGA